eukprot:snap_masked-scaffold_7-processed-gene-3.15-mRNA-1 protein AED:1.00 eAED:1.00 QI:0/-1/0/0/-1/1/1/0/539
MNVVNKSEHGKEKRNFWRLSLEEQPPLYIFQDDVLSLRLIILDQQNKVVFNPTLVDLAEKTLSIKTTLKSALLGGGKKLGQAVVSVQNSKFTFENGACTLKTRVQELSSNHNDQPFILSFEVSLPEGENYPLTFQTGNNKVIVGGIQSVSTTSFRVVTHRLNFLNPENYPKVWFKDQGGRDKVIEAAISLSSCSKHNSKNIDMPLNIYLVYTPKTLALQKEAFVCDLEPVNKQKRKILNIHGTSETKISKGENVALIRFRIEDVSKNHQSNSFSVVVEPSNPLQKLNVAPVILPGITVKSKSTKKQKLSSKKISNGNSLNTNQKKIKVDPSLLTAPSIIKTEPSSTSPDEQITNILNHLKQFALNFVHQVESLETLLIGKQKPDLTEEGTKDLQFNFSQVSELVRQRAGSQSGTFFDLPGFSAPSNPLIQQLSTDWLNNALQREASNIYREHSIKIFRELSNRARLGNSTQQPDGTTDSGINSDFQKVANLVAKEANDNGTVIQREHSLVEPNSDESKPRNSIVDKLYRNYKSEHKGKE